MKFHPLRLLFACILALAACGPAPERNAETETTSAAPAFSSSFRCSGETVGWRGSGETSTLEARGETFELRQAVTASGAYSAAAAFASWLFHAAVDAAIFASRSSSKLF